MHQELHLHHDHPQHVPDPISSTESSPLDGPHADIPSPRQPLSSSTRISSETPRATHVHRHHERRDKSRPPPSTSPGPGAIAISRTHGRKHKSSSSTSSQLLIANERLQQQVARVNTLESETSSLFQLVKSNHEKFLETQSQLAKTKTELEMYKIQYELAQKEIDKANQAVKVADVMRHDAEERELRERERRRKLQEETLVLKASRDGYSEGYLEGKKYFQWLAQKQEDIDKEIGRRYVNPYVRKSTRSENTSKRPPVYDMDWGNQTFSESVRSNSRSKSRTRTDPIRPKSASAATRAPPRQENKDDSSSPSPPSPRSPKTPPSPPTPPDVAKYPEPLPIPTITTPMPLRVPSTQPQQAPQMGRPHSSASTKRRPPIPKYMITSNKPPTTQHHAHHERHAHNEAPIVKVPSSGPRVPSPPLPPPPPPPAQDTAQAPSLLPQHNSRPGAQPLQGRDPHSNPSRSTTHLLDDHGPHGEPAQEVHPVLVHNRPPSPTHSYRSRSRSFVLPPDNYIPTVDASSGRVVLPPPHELTMPVPTEDEAMSMMTRSRAGSVADTQSVRSRRSVSRSRSNSHPDGTYRPVMMDQYSYTQNQSRAANDTWDRSYNAISAADISRPSTRISQYDLVSPPRGRVLKDSAYNQAYWGRHTNPSVSAISLGTPTPARRNLRDTERIAQDWRRNNQYHDGASSRRSYYIANPDRGEDGQPVVNSSGDSYGGGHGYGYPDMRYARSSTPPDAAHQYPTQRSRTPLREYGGPRPRTPHLASTAPSQPAGIQPSTSYNRADAGGTPYVQPSPLYKNGSATQHDQDLSSNAPENESPRTPTEPPIVQLEEEPPPSALRGGSGATTTPFGWLKSRFSLKRSKSSPMPVHTMGNGGAHHAGVAISVEPPSGSPSSASYDANESVVDPVLLTPEGLSPALPPAPLAPVEEKQYAPNNPVPIMLPDNRLPPGFVPQHMTMNMPMNMGYHNEPIIAMNVRVPPDPPIGGYQKPTSTSGYSAASAGEYALSRSAPVASHLPQSRPGFGYTGNTYHRSH